MTDALGIGGLFSAGRARWRRGARRLAEMLPKGLFARSLLIVVLPIALLQVAVVYLFMLRHYERVTDRLSQAVARDVGAVVDLVEKTPGGGDRAAIWRIADARFHMQVTLSPPAPLPEARPKSIFDALDPLRRDLPDRLAEQLDEPFWVDTTGRGGLLEIRVETGQGVVQFFLPRTLAFEPNAHIFILWMVFASAILGTVAILFLRNQIRPILSLADAAESFGKGQDHEFRPRGAAEVRRAGHAFVEMKRRIERAADQRTTFLNGVSHDLRTMLTRFKLSLALLEPTEDVDALQKDVAEMNAMLDSYLAYARGDVAEETRAIDVGDVLEALRADAERAGVVVRLALSDDLTIKARPLAIKRCLANLVGNAQKHARAIALSASRDSRYLIVNVDDDGPGIPPQAREDVFRPFVRLDESRNQDDAGAGLGLSISREIARAHGGDVTLSTSPLGGLRASVRLPV